MRNPLLTNTLSLALCSAVALAGCGLEGFFSNELHNDYDRPASAVAGAGPAGARALQFNALSPDSKTLIPPFMTLLPGRGPAGGYEMRLPSSKYAMIRADFRGGNLWLRRILTSVGEESAVTGVDLDARAMTEALIIEARLSANRGKLGEPTSFGQLSPDVYKGTHAQIYADMDADVAPVKDLLAMVTKLMTLYANDAGDADPVLFKLPVLGQDYSVSASPVDANWLKVNLFDFGDGLGQTGKSTHFDALLGQAAAKYDPKGCIDPGHIRVVFTVDFNKTSTDGNGAAIDMFRWAKDKPGKQMYFASWIHADSAVQDNAVASLLGNGTPNVVKMYDDGTNGDEKAGDGIWTITFSLPYDDPRLPGKSTDTVKNLRLGYKYTWGSQGSTWTGSEEWPGNSRIIEIVDVNGDGFVYRRDVFGDEATNKDKSNFNTNGKGTCDWTTDFRGCGGNANPLFHSYEVYEQPFVPGGSKACGASWFVPTAVSPVRVACQ